MEPQEQLTHAPQGGVRAMFDRVAPRYDLINRLLSMGIDQRWRRQTVSAMKIAPGERVLDLCTGTCDLALGSMKYKPSQVVGFDLSRQMLLRGERKVAGLPIALMQGDAAYLPFKDNSFDRACVGFGIRNVGQIDRALEEVARVMRPGGRFALLEFTLPPNPLIRTVYATYFRHVLPTVGGWISGDPEAYRYLPESVGNFPNPPEFRDRLLTAGFSTASFALLTGGIACLYIADR